ncbi:hypothetical protein OQA88_6986 [Cercophora sp. LCS_1]
MAGLLKAIILAVVLITRPVAAADDGDDFSNNLFSDLAPLLALFGERVTTQFMSQAVGWADNIILAMGPLGIVTIIVSTIRVGGPIWLRAIVGRARENRAVAEEELMSSTSEEVSELWNGQKIVRVAGKPSIAEFICLLPLGAGAETESAVSEGAMADGQSQPDNDPFEVVSLEDAVKKDYIREVNQDIPGKRIAHRVAHAVRYLWRRDGKSLDDPERTKGIVSNNGSQASVPKKFIIVRNKTNAAPNLLLNIDRFSSPSELWAVATIGTMLQLGVLVYGGFITYHPSLLFKFQKGGNAVAHYAYPCTAVGTLLVVLGLIACSHVVESSTHEKFYVPNGFEARMVYLQKAGTVGDQSFDSFAIFAKEAKSVIVTSRRNDETTTVVLETKTVIGMFLALSGFVVQFVGLRSMNWSATIAQLVAVLIMTALRALVRRDLAKTPTTEKLLPGVELDWLATRLSFRFFHGLPDQGNEGDRPKSTEPPSAKKKGGRSETPGSADSWLKSSTDVASPRTSGTSCNTTHKSRPQSWIFKVVEASGTPSQETQKASMAHSAMKIRKGLADLAPWPRPLSAEARAVVTAIESTMNYFDDQSVFCPPEKPRDTPPSTLGAGRDGLHDESFVWHVETLRHGKIYFTVKRQRGKWKASEPEVEAALSLWDSDDLLHKPETGSVLVAGPDVASLPRDSTKARRALQLLGPSSPRLRRDLRWWLPGETAKIMTVRAAGESARAAGANGGREEEYHGVFGCGHSDGCPGWTETVRYRTMELLWPYDTTSTFPTTTRIPFLPRNELLLATTHEQPARRLFAQHLFTAFMWALAREKMQRPIPGRANIQASDLSQLDVSPHSWRLFTLQNQQFSRVVQDIHATGLGSLNDIYFCIIPPLSQTHRLPQTDSVVKWAQQHLLEPGPTGRWSKVVNGLVWLLGTFPDGDPVRDHLVPLAVSGLLLLAQECMARKRQMYPEDDVKELESLKCDLESMLKTDNGAHHSLSVARGYAPATNYRYPEPILASMEQEWSYDYSDGPERSANLNIQDAFSRTALHYAEVDGHYFAGLSKVREMINAQDCLGWSPLHFASNQDSGGADDKVARLIQAGADVGLRSLEGFTPLHCAAMAGATKSVMELVEAGADVNVLDSLRNTPLHWAAFLGHDDIVTELLGLTNQGLRTIGGRTVLHQFALRDKATTTGTEYESVLQSILKQGYDASAKDRFGRVALHYAASSGLENVVKSDLLPKHGADGIDILDNEGMRPIDFAAAHGHDNLVEYLFNLWDGASKKEQVRHRNRKDATLLHHAAGGDCRSLLSSLLLPGGWISLDWVDGWNMSALHYAAINGRTATLKLLAETQPDLLSAEDCEGNTALHLAAESGNKDCVLYLETKLTERGEERWLVAGEGMTPLHLAVKHVDDVAMVNFLLKAGCPIDQKDRYGYTALHLAAIEGHVAIAEALLGWKPQAAQVGATTNVGDQPLACAAFCGSVQMVELLVKSGAETKVRDKDGKTPFLVAARYELAHSEHRLWIAPLREVTAQRKVNVLQLLIETGADPHDVDQHGRSARDVVFDGHKGDDDEDTRNRQLVAGYLECLLL